ncbi:MAG: hypothetical protein AAFQ84_07920 [Pseudomonadota bacterium]
MGKSWRAVCCVLASLGIGYVPALAASPISPLVDVVPMPAIETIPASSRAFVHGDEHLQTVQYRAEPRRYHQKSKPPARRAAPVRYRDRRRIIQTRSVVTEGSAGVLPSAKFTHGEAFYGGHLIYIRPRRDGFAGGQRVRRPAPPDPRF